MSPLQPCILAIFIIITYYKYSAQRRATMAQQQ